MNDPIEEAINSLAYKLEQVYAERDAIRQLYNEQRAQATRLRTVLRRIIDHTPHSMCSDAHAWAEAEILVQKWDCDD